MVLIFFKFLLLKFLPRRLLPLLLLYEAWKLVMRMRTNDDPTAPHRVTIDGHATVVPAREDAIR